jgi:hypothetical protein
MEPGLPTLSIAGGVMSKNTKKMGVCEVCGNEYDKTFQITLAGETHTFDSFECAIHALAPTCNHCGCRILGHGAENEHGVLFCCAHCANQEGVQKIVDRAS